VDLSGLIGGMAELLNASISKKASLRFNLATALPFIKGDEPQLQQIALNLITNASEALGDRPGVITVTTRLRECDEGYLANSRVANRLVPGTYLLLEVQDTGCGMDESTQKQIFDPFFTTKFTGRGLGMSAVSGLMRGHNGGILVSSQPGLGARVTVLFPVVAGTTALVAKPMATPPVVKEGNPVLLDGTVLVVDDEAPIRMLIEQILKRTGLRVLTAADGEEAVALFRQRASEITFVILDLTMPKMDGSRTLVELRRHQPQVKAVLISGYDAANVQQRADGEGFVAFLRKPFQIEALVGLARRLCANQS
jgi:CheY-like chemotaxis protein